MIPDRMPNNGASQGEKDLFAVLQRLPEDYIVYYEPVVNERYPDFIVICPDMGVLVIEVKGWRAKDIIAGDSNNITIAYRQTKQQQKHTHPVRQAREYMYRLMDKSREYPESRNLIHSEGENQNRFTFPFGHFAVLSNITSEQLKNHSKGDFTEIFPASKVADRDTLKSWLDESLSEQDLCGILRSYFDPFWKIDRLTQSQINTLRAIVHPEIVLSGKVEETANENKLQPSLKVLDTKQENNARRIGNGHRIIYGVAGSGKTVLLIARAKILSRDRSDDRILLLCYNVTLAAYLESVLKECKNINVTHFDGWAKQNRATRKKDESDKDLGDRLLKFLDEGGGDCGKYDAVMIDEAQDFEVSWFKCVLEAMKDPDDGDLLIVGDGSQGLYPHVAVRWKEIGIQASGRTYFTKFDLDKNYRNSRQIIELAALFASKSEKKDTDILAIQVDPDKCVRSAGFKPVLVKSQERKEESIKIVETVKNLLSGNWFGKEIEPLQPKEIGIFYPRMYKNDRATIENLIENLHLYAPTIWLSDPQNRANRRKVSHPGIKLQTIHSAKGLQYRAVILMWADRLPGSYKNSEQLEQRHKLLYVGLTRPEDFLVVSASGSSKFVAEIENSGKIILDHTLQLSPAQL